VRSIFNCGALGAALAAGSAWAQCVDSWRPGAPVQGVAGEVTAMTLWDPDGNGPRGQELVVAGALVLAGDVPVQTVALWDGTSFRPLAPGATFTTGPCGAGGLCAPRINVLTTFQGELIAAGRFTVGPFAPPRSDLNIARWTGSSWEALGSGLAPNADMGLPFDVIAVAPWQNSLVALANDGTYVLNQGTWSLLSGPSNTPPFDLVSFNGELFRAGQFAGVGPETNQAVQRWNGSAWESVWLPFDRAEGADLFVFGNELHAVVFDLPPTSFPVGTRVVKWLGGRDWQSVGGSLSANRPRLASLGSDLYVFGELFGAFSGIPARGVMRLQGGEWEAIGEPLPEGVPGLQGVPRAAAAFQNELILGGLMSRAGSVAMNNIVGWNGSAWRSLEEGGSNGGIGALATNGGAAYALGGFGVIEGVEANRVARLSNGVWEPLGEGFPLGGVSLAPFQNSVALGTGVGTTAQVFTFDGVQWNQLGQDLFSGGFLTTAYVSALNDGLYTGMVASQQPLWKLEDQFWTPIAFAPSPLTSVLSITRLGERLVVGGTQFLASDGVGPSSCVAFVNADGSFEVVGGENEEGRAVLRGAVSTLEVFQGKLFAGGAPIFIENNGVLGQTGGLVMWDGVQWTQPGGGLAGFSRQPVVFDMAVRGNRLIVTGLFDQAGAAAARNIAAWDGTNWSALGSGLGNDNSIANPTIQAGTSLAVLGDELLVGGGFLTAGGQPSAFFARFGCSGSPTCDSIDFNNDGSLFDPDDVDALFSVFSEGPCIPAQAMCNDVDFNNDGSLFDPCDIDSFFLVFSEGPCTLCGV
jgi:hypothetical protein